MSGQRLTEIDELLTRARHLPEWDQYLAALRDLATALDELDELGPLVPWRPRRLIRARHLLRQCDRARGFATVEKARLEAMHRS